MQIDDEAALLKRLGIDFQLLDDGCCGMAGSFGFEEEKYDISVACAEQGLLPAVRKTESDAFVIADGFSCQEQIRQLSDREALHIAQVIQFALHNAEGLNGGPPEQCMVKQRATGSTALYPAQQWCAGKRSSCSRGGLVSCCKGSNRTTPVKQKHRSRLELLLETQFAETEISPQVALGKATIDCVICSYQIRNSIRFEDALSAIETSI